MKANTELQQAILDAEKFMSEIFGSESTYVINKINELSEKLDNMNNEEFLELAKDYEKSGNYEADVGRNSPEFLRIT